jgi:hypothetical protein
LPAAALSAAEPEPAAEESGATSGEKVVSLDSFRKKP